jgi:hypothetical protein
MRDKSMADTQTSKRKPKGAHPHKRLTASQVKSLKRGRHADGNGLYLVVDETGARRWVLRTIVHGRRRDIGLGGTLIVSLAEARARALELRKAAREGLDPIAERDRHKSFSPTFAEAARLVHAEQIKSIANNGKHVHQWIRTLETYAFPVVGPMPMPAGTAGTLGTPRAGLSKPDIEPEQHDAHVADWVDWEERAAIC